MIWYIAGAVVFYIVSIIWQARSREGLFVYHLPVGIFFAMLWPVCLVVIVGGWVLSRKFWDKRIRW